MVIFVMVMVATCNVKGKMYFIVMADQVFATDMTVMGIAKISKGKRVLKIVVFTLLMVLKISGFTVRKQTQNIYCITNIVQRML